MSSWHIALSTSQEEAQNMGWWQLLEVTYKLRIKYGVFSSDEQHRRSPTISWFV